MEEKFEKNVRFFKLTYSGMLVEPEVESEEEKLELFNINNIIAVHVKKKKRMYIWVGKHSTQSLQYYISKIRAIISREYSDLVTLRYIHIDSGSEVSEFFESTEISEANLLEQLNYQEKILAPKISEISDLKKMADEYFMAEDYEKVIDISQKLIDLAEEMSDEGLKKDQKAFLTEAEQRFELKKLIVNAERDCEEISKDFSKFLIDDKIIDAHNLVENFKNKYNTIELNSIPKIEDLLSKEKETWTNFLKNQENLIEEIDALEKKIIINIENQKIEAAEEIFQKAEKLLDHIINEKVRNKWQEIKITVSKSREDYDNMIQNSKDIIAELTKKIETNQENNELELMIENCQSIIMHSKILNDEDLIEKFSYLLDDLIQKRQLNELKEKINDLRQEARHKLLEGKLFESMGFYDQIISQLKDFMNN